MSLDSVSVLDGNTFVVSDRRGDLEATPLENHGLFLNDTRFLSRWILTINGQKPKLLSVDLRDYFDVRFFLALATGTIYADSRLSVARRRAVNGGFFEEIFLVNHDKEPVKLDVRIEAAADFADLFEVKDKLPKKGELFHSNELGVLTFAYRRGSYRRETRITSSAPAEILEDGLRFNLELPPHSEWNTKIEVAANIGPNQRSRTPRAAGADGGDVQSWVSGAPELHSSWTPLERTYQRSLTDLAALRFRTPFTPGALPAAGLPWFMTVFGRDSLLTSFQAIPFLPELAATTLKVLALLQGRLDDPFRDEEPGKIIHEIRLGEMAGFEERPQTPYYGAADSTALWLILLEEYDRWSGDHALAKSLERKARAGVAWIDRYGDRDHDGYVEYERRMETGLENQCWKDSWDSIAFADGTLAKTPIATCEIQGYVYDAKKRTARLARDVWGDPAWADELDRQAEGLKRRFNEDFWVADREFFALALDGKKRKVDSLTSNIGHLLWSGIVASDRVERCVRHLMSEELFSGWGVRTMARTEGSFNPLGYHVGTVWPHDCSFIAWGVKCAGYKAEAARLSLAMLEAAEAFEHRLPEAFAGYPREQTKFPVEYPTACSPQAWASGAPLLLLRTLLGLESDGRHLIIDPALPRPLDRVEILNIPGCWGKMDAFGLARLDLKDRAA